MRRGEEEEPQKGRDQGREEEEKREEKRQGWRRERERDKGVGLFLPLARAVSFLCVKER